MIKCDICQAEFDSSNFLSTLPSEYAPPEIKHVCKSCERDVDDFRSRRYNELLFPLNDLISSFIIELTHEKFNAKSTD